MVDAQLMARNGAAYRAGRAMEAYSFLVVWNHCILPFRFSPSLL